MRIAAYVDDGGLLCFGCNSDPDAQPLYDFELFEDDYCSVCMGPL